MQKLLSLPLLSINEGYELWIGWPAYMNVGVCIHVCRCVHACVCAYI